MPRYNEEFANIMEQCAIIMANKGEKFRAKAYKKAQETILSFPTDIKKPSDLKGAPGIGNTVMEKLNEYALTGTLLLIENEKQNPIAIFSEIYGVGPKKAAQIVEYGISTIEQLRENQNLLLNDTQKIGLRYYEDILERIPRAEIILYQSSFQLILTRLNNNLKFEIVGSFRRGANTSGDIDVILTCENQKQFTTFIDELIRLKIIEEVLSRGPKKCLVIGRLSSEHKARRIDFLNTSKEEYPFAILYFTGSKNFNTEMRRHALSLGYTMNEHGITSLNNSNNNILMNTQFNKEEDIFKFLGLDYKQPNERN